MSIFMNVLIIGLTVIMLVGSVWLLIATGKTAPGEKVGAVKKDHVWDEDLVELNNPLPRWWLFLFIITILFAIGYLALYPGLGSYQGTLGWTQLSQLKAQQEEADAKMAPVLAELGAKSIAELQAHPDALRIGGNLFANNCATCHGSDAAGAPGYPNLTDGSWNWGSSDADLIQTITNGRQAAMPPWEAALGESGVAETAVYVQQLAGGKVDEELAAKGKKHYDTLCVACHGPNGNGNQMLGSPALNDRIWQYGGDYASIKHSIAKGRNGMMPAQKDLLTAEEIKILVGYLRSVGPTGDSDAS